MNFLDDADHKIQLYRSKQYPRCYTLVNPSNKILVANWMRENPDKCRFMVRESSLKWLRNEGEDRIYKLQIATMAWYDHGIAHYLSWPSGVKKTTLPEPRPFTPRDQNHIDDWWSRSQEWADTIVESDPFLDRLRQKSSISLRSRSWSVPRVEKTGGNPDGDAYMGRRFRLTGPAARSCASGEIVAGRQMG